MARAVSRQSPERAERPPSLGSSRQITQTESMRSLGRHSRRVPRMRRIGVCARWPRRPASPAPRFIEFGRPSGCSRIGSKHSNFPRVRSLQRRFVTLFALDMASPERATVVCVDEKSQVQAQDRTESIFPTRPGVPERQTHDYAWRGVTSLSGAFDVAPITRERSLELVIVITDIRSFCDVSDASMLKFPET